jgi:hypothetical protein
MRVAIGRIGKSLKFKEATFSPIGGACESANLYLALFKKYPEIDWYIVGPTDFYGLDQFENVHTVMKSSIHTDITGYIDDYVKSTPPFDFGIFFVSQVFGANIKGRTIKRCGTKYKTLMAADNYTGPYLNLLNQMKFPYALICNDPRSLKQKFIPDMCHKPKIIFGQYDETLTLKSYANNPENYTAPLDIVNYDVKYSGVEKLFLIGKTHMDLLKKSERPYKLNFICHEGDKSRFQEISEYVLTNDLGSDDYGIWGKWSTTQGYEHVFRGCEKFNNLIPIFQQTRYTLLVPIRYGWATAKFWEMIWMGVIPFMHPTYDIQGHINCPSFLRVNSPKEFKEKINVLENDDELYNFIVDELQNMMTQEDFSGEKIMNMLMGEFK